MIARVGILLGGVSRGLRWTVLAAVAGACATVVHDEPPSTLAESAGAGGAGAAGIAQNGDAGRAESTARPPTAGATGSGGLGGAFADGGGAGELPGSDGPAGAAGETDAGPRLPPGTVLLAEDFEDFGGSTWSTTEGSAWAIGTDAEVSGNVYVQTETTSSGRHLAMSGDASWTDVIVQADFKVLSFNGSASGYMAGVCFRISDPDNFYMAGMRGDGTSRIQVRSFGDDDTNLDQSTAQGSEGVWHTLRVEAMGSRIVVYLDDALVLAVEDTRHPSGAVGLCTVRAAAVFDNVVVTAP